MDSIAVAAAPKAAPIMTITPDVAAQFTLTPEVCLRQGTFPFFAEEVTGMFIRVKYSNSAASALQSGDNAALASQSAVSGESSTQLVQSQQGGDGNNYLWTRIRRVVTHYDLQREMEGGEKSLDVIGDIDAHLTTTPSDTPVADEKRWKSKILANPSYKWRGRVFDVYFLCEHPVFGKTPGGDDDSSSSSSSRLMLVDLRILAKNWQPTREDINLYTSDLTHPSGNIISGSDEEKRLFAKYTSVFLRYPVSPSSTDNLPAILSTTAFAKSEQPRDAPSAAHKRGFGQEALNHYLYNPAAVSGVAGTASSAALSSDSKDAFSFLVGASPSDVAAAWTVHIRRYLTSRPLSAIDSKKLVEANTRKLEEAGGGNAVLGYTAAQNDLLYQRYLALRRAKEEELLGVGASSTTTTSSQDIFADAQREAEEMTRREMGIVVDLPTSSQDDNNRLSSGSTQSMTLNPIVAETEDKFYNYVSNPERNNGLDSLVHLSKRNFKHNSEKTVAMTAFFKLRVEKEGAYHIPAAGSVLWTVDRAERDRMCKVKIDEEHEKWDRETKKRAKDDAAKAKRPLGYADDSRIDALIRDRVQKSIAAASSSSQQSTSSTPVAAVAGAVDEDDNDDDLLALARASSGNLRPVGSQTSSTSSPSATRASLLVKSLSGIKRPRSETTTA
eukprot:TRINITY_DN17779_c0_g2_i2.p1 TRINITY_DN17779_c0_g2~~TRINITY_DN17779_c0_g2_i2.p1  ORF type:complete len:669 (-),score=223.85 TRINITY_DN17779_c0_g2_i2:188-2194(-)